jgi:hypothetical protein
MGGHNCLYYDSLKDLCGVVASFLRDGMRKHMLCLWIIPEGMEVETAKGALRGMLEGLDGYVETGLLEIQKFREWYLPSGTFNPEEILNAWAQKESQALERGFSALCAVGDASWLFEKDREKLIVYESAAEKIISQSKISALCTYANEKLSPEEKETLSKHHGTILSNLHGMLTISN